MSKCEWCRNPNAEDATRPEDLCNAHAAEYDGVTLGQFERQEADQRAEWLDTLG